MTALHGMEDSNASQVEMSKGLKGELASPGRELLKIVKLPKFRTRVCISRNVFTLLSSTDGFCLQTITGWSGCQSHG